MEFLRYFVYMCILMSLKSQFIVGYTKDCDCTGTIKMVNSVRNILHKDMFDMKLKNDMLTSKIDRLEQMFQEQFPLSVLSAPQVSCEPNCSNGGVCFKDNTCRCQRFTTGTRCENFLCEPDCSNGGVCFKDNTCRCQRFTTGTRCENFLCEPNCSNGGVCFKDNTCICQRFTTGTRCENFLCEPNCNNGGECFKDNTCSCRNFTSGSRCENYFCDDSCAENEGECVGPGSCECPDHRYGVVCELGEANITGVYVDGSPGSRLEYESSQVSSKLSNVLSIEFKTRDENGVIFYCASRSHNEHMSIIMKKGFIQCSFSCGTGTGRVTIPQKRNDGNWHKLTFWRNMTVGSLEVDNNVPLSWRSLGPYRYISIKTPFYFGGVNQSQLSERAIQNLNGVKQSFKGCLANIKADKDGKIPPLSLGVPTKKIGTKRCLDMLQP